MIRQAELLEILQNRFSTDNKSDISGMEKSISLGVVTSTDDPLEMGRLQVFCPSWGDNPEKIHELPWTTYASPFGGVINNDRFLRGSEKVGSTGSVAYGMWGIPELGSSVVTACIDQDLRKRIWWAVIFDQQETNTILTGRFKWNSDGSVEGPLTSQGLPLEPLYSNFKTAFSSKTNSPEWKTRAATYQAAAVNKDLNQPPTPNEEPSLDQQTDDIRNNTNFSWDKNRMGTHGYDQSGFAEMPFKGSKAFGFSSPGGHTILMDDKPYNCRTQITTVHGHSILLDDTNERINIRTANGAAWFEMDYSGNIDVYAKKRFSVHAEDDINFFSDKSVRIQGTEGVYIYAGADNGLEKIAAAPAIGQVRIQAQDDLHLLSKNLRQMSFESTMFEVGSNLCITVGQSFNTQVQNDINLITNSGNYNTSITGDLNTSASGNSNIFTVGESTIASKSNMDIYSYEGTTNIAAMADLVLKSMSGSVIIQSVGSSGSVVMKSPNSQMGITNSGMTISTSGTLDIQSGNDITLASNTTTLQTISNPLVTADKTSFDTTMQADNELLVGLSNPLCSTLKMQASTVSMQALGDIEMVSINQAMSTPVIAGIVDKLNTATVQLDTLAYYTSTIVSTIGSIIGSSLSFPVDAGSILSALNAAGFGIPAGFGAIIPLINGGLNISINQLESYVMPTLKSSAETIYHNVAG